MNIKTFNKQLKKLYPILKVELISTGISNMFSNNGIDDTYEELNLYRNNIKVKTLMTKTVISKQDIETCLNNHYQKFIEPKLNKQP